MMKIASLTSLTNLMDGINIYAEMNMAYKHQLFKLQEVMGKVYNSVGLKLWVGVYMIKIILRLLQSMLINMEFPLLLLKMESSID